VRAGGFFAVRPSVTGAKGLYAAPGFYVQRGLLFRDFFEDFPPAQGADIAGNQMPAPEDFIRDALSQCSGDFRSVQVDERLVVFDQSY
jgi:hypothetical protein